MQRRGGREGAAQETTCGPACRDGGRHYSTIYREVQVGHLPGGNRQGIDASAFQRVDISRRPGGKDHFPPWS